MITKVGEKDRFGYDDSGRPVAAQMIPGFVAFGYVFCARLKTTMEAGFTDGTRLFADGAAILYIYSPSAKATELWSGRWVKDDTTGLHSVNPQYLGVLDKTFDNFDEVRLFFETPQPISLRPEYLTIDGEMQSHADIVADREFALGLANAPKRFPERRINRQPIPREETESADDVDFLMYNIYSYVFRFHAASKLMLYANTLHFSRPQFIPQSEATFFISMAWRQMAARDAIFSLYHFQHSFEILRKEAIRRAPVLRGAFDLVKLRLAWKLFHSQFKDVVPMRNALGHEGEFYSTTRARTKHSGDRNMFLEFVISGEVYSIASFGRPLSLDLSQKAGQKLERIKLLIVDSLATALAPATVRKATSPQPTQN